MAIVLKKAIVLNSHKETQAEENKKPRRKSHTGNTLPPDTYKEEIEPIRIKVDEYSELNFSVKRGGEMGLPKVDIRHFQTTKVYTGFTQRAVNFPVELLDGFIETLQFIQKEIKKKNW